MKSRSSQVYEFGPYRLQVGERRLWKGSEEIRLRPKLLDLLGFLVENHGHMIDKEDLIQCLWGDSIVEEGNLTVTVNALRTALGTGRYIETVTRRGYRFIADVKVLYGGSIAPAGPTATVQWAEPPGGAVPLQSGLYVRRSADDEFCNAIGRGDSIVLVKGARQVGKTSLLARGLQEARSHGAAIVLIDFQQFNADCFASTDRLFMAMAELIAYQLDLTPAPHMTWSSFLSPSSNFDRYMRTEVLGKTSSHLVWGLDEVDRLFSFRDASEIFGLFRSWHNVRALDPEGPCHRLTLTIAYATEAHLFITDLNQSPFNVGTRLTLDDFTVEQVMDLNRRYGEPLRDTAEGLRLHKLLGGHPYLTQRGLYEIARGKTSLAVIEEQADRDEAVFGDHLKRMLLSLEQDKILLEEVRAFAISRATFSNHALSRLRGAGILSGDLSQTPSMRCELYDRYLKRHLG